MVEGWRAAGISSRVPPAASAQRAAASRPCARTGSARCRQAAGPFGRSRVHAAEQIGRPAIGGAAGRSRVRKILVGLRPQQRAPALDVAAGPDPRTRACIRTCVPASPHRAGCQCSWNSCLSFSDAAAQVIPLHRRTRRRRAGFIENGMYQVSACSSACPTSWCRRAPCRDRSKSRQ